MRLFFLITLCMPLLLGAANNGDIYLKNVNGQQAILHTVEAGQTLYFISKKYNTTVEKIKQDNPSAAQDELVIGNMLVIYFDKSLLVDVTKVDQSMCQPLFHKVEKGETLYGLAKRTYNLEIAQLKTWNRLNSNEISIGQNIIVGWIYSNTGYAQNAVSDRETKDYRVDTNTKSTNTSNGNTTTTKTPTEEPVGRIVYVSKGIQSGESNVYTSPKNPYEKPAQTTTTTKQNTDTKITDIGQKTVENSTINIPDNKKDTATSINNNEVQPVLSTPVALPDDKRLPRAVFKNMEEDTSGAYSLKNETGAAKWFKPQAGSLQIYALHKDAPIGTVLKISNPINNYTVYVKVIDNLPNTDENHNTLLKLSSNAMDLLKAYDKVFMVETAYFIKN